MGEEAVRLRFAFNGDTIHLVRRELVQTRAPASDASDADLLSLRGPVTGYWIELRRADGTPAYRRLLHDPFGLLPEVPNDTGGWTRIPLKTTQGAFSLLLPALPDAQSVVLLGPAASPGRPSLRELGSFPFQPSR